MLPMRRRERAMIVHIYFYFSELQNSVFNYQKMSYAIYLYTKQ